MKEVDIVEYRISNKLAALAPSAIREIFKSLTDPEIMGPNLEYLGYSAPSTAAKEFMDPEIASDPIAYPDEETLERGSSFRSLSLEGTQEMNRLWLEVKTADTATTVYSILTVAAIVLVLLLWIFFKVRKRRKKSRRCQKWKANA